jgi:hypothetical protein
MLLLYLVASCCACDKAMSDTEDNGNIQGYADSQLVGSWKITAISSDNHTIGIRTALWKQIFMLRGQIAAKTIFTLSLEIKQELIKQLQYF